MAFQGVSKTLKEIYSEPGPQGTLSWGRVAATITLLAAIAWVTRIVLMTHALPALDGITAFGLAPYAANRIQLPPILTSRKVKFDRTTECV
jgi:hypothetical protein